MSPDPESQSSSQYLSSSHSSLNQSKRHSSEISKIYKHASQLYLTRRLAEAYEALQPVIKRPEQANGTQSDGDLPLLAPIATATTSQRIKTWSLYASLLNAILELGNEEGKSEFGQKQYREIVRLVQSSEVWEQVVQEGYRGREASVDAEVVYNLSTLLLGQAQNQTLNQARLETYLSSSPSQPHLDLSTHINESFTNGDRSQMNGTSTPKDLTSRIKIIELFTLHVLPKNKEWDYARSFISNSDVLDEERREAFLQTLAELQQANEQEDALGDDFTDAYSDQEPEPAYDNTESVSQRHANGTRRGHQRTSSEVDYGIEKDHPNGAQVQPPSQTKDSESQPPMTSLPPQPEPSSYVSRPSQLSPPAQTPRRPTRRSKAQSQNTLMAQARKLYAALSNLARNLAGSMTGNPTALFQFLLFILAFFMAFSRKEIRDRARQILGKSWEKLASTVGMGTKVSYI